jgi:hypothetical protein
MPGSAGLANHEFTLEPRLIVLIRGLLLFPLALRLNLVILFARRSGEWADDDFSLHPLRLVRPKVDRLAVAGRGNAKSVPRERRSGLRCTAVSQRTAPREHQRGNKEREASQNHRDHSTTGQSNTQSGGPTLAHRHRHIAINSTQIQKPSSARPIQLNANIEQAIAATDANVAIVFTDLMTKPFAGNG